jgi:hypothetical protein
VNAVVYCQNCRKEFSNYRKIGQHIKEQLLSGLAQKAGTVPVETFLGTMIENPVGGIAVAVGNHEVLMTFPKVAQAHYGSRRDACNAAQVPCPVCRKFFHWKRGNNQ